MKNDEHMQLEINELRKKVEALRLQRLERTPKTEPVSALDAAPAAMEESLLGETEKSVSELDWTDLEKIFDDLVSATHDEIEDHPVGAISIAFLLGFMLGRGT
ncbi:MAG: ElaB/YqjD/DUF883 family membrane-anchored ribosome-binding protein [Granulosicoccus sp.]|jgi:ElaB/YqjD/DUF883 family membrane-anchored ribosome-binding protein